MAQNLDKYRRQLYKIIRENTPNFTQEEFDAQFTDKETFESFVDKIEKNKKKKVKGKTWDKITFSSLATYYKMYACDMPWAQNLGYCGGVNNVNSDSYVGEYTNDLIKKIRVYTSKDENDVDVLYLGSIYLDKIPGLSKLIGDDRFLTLSPTDKDTFTISNSQGVLIPNFNVTFTPDSLSVNVKIVNIYKELVKAKKITGKDDEDTTSTEDDEKKTDTVTNTTIKTDIKKSVFPVVKSKPLYFNKDKKVDVPTKDCIDFPFTLGCVNTKIGDLNAKLFNGDRLNDTYGKELEHLLLNTANFSNSNNELTQKTWDYIMNKSIIKESVKKVLKEYINKK
jgi:hypothetical protein